MAVWGVDLPSTTWGYSEQHQTLLLVLLFFSLPDIVSSELEVLDLPYLGHLGVEVFVQQVLKWKF